MEEQQKQNKINYFNSVIDFLNNQQNELKKIKEVIDKKLEENEFKKDRRLLRTRKRIDKIIFYTFNEMKKAGEKINKLEEK